MSNHKRWVQRGGNMGDFMKWEEPGQELIGKWRGTKPGKFGDLGMVDTETGERAVFPLHTALALLVEGLEDGKEVKIVYTGKIDNPKTGREFKAFDLFTAEDGDTLAASDDDSIPF